MIELPEATVIARQIATTLTGKRIASAVANQSPHKFAWYTGDPAEYNQRLAGKTIGTACALAGSIEVEAGDMLVSVSAPIRYHAQGAKRPQKHQLLITFEDGTAMSSSAQMWGGFLCFPIGERSGSPDRDIALQRPSPLTDAFDRAYFQTLLDADTLKLSAKAFLATEQRFPGLGNGVLQDILWTARIHPKRKTADLPAASIDALFAAVKGVLADMTAKGGRDTERDLFGNPGGYTTILSRNTVGTPCPACGAVIRKEPYLGGAIYYCPGCQPI
ncbi:MAG TPA: endonuclease VIII [Chloroflexi bacterium]|jgi:formamidopyrimidine-DNA glycosylase|nr:endonuclease VIII [Chloroflexota bacterium]